MTFNRNRIYTAILATPLALLGTGVMAQETVVVEEVVEVNQAKDAEYAQRIQALEAELEVLKGDVSTNKEDIEFNRPAKKGTQFQYGGYIQMDTMYSDYSEGKYSNNLIEDFLVPSLIPVENADPAVESDNFTSTNMHAKTSRFYFTTLTNTAAGAISSRIEIDFILSGQGDERISNSEAPRLRHAFVKWQYSERGSLLAGQTWGTFFNVGALPDLLDFVGPVGTLFNRQPMLRWTQGGFQFALENPYTRLSTYDGSQGNNVQSDSETIPDVVLRYNGNAGGLGWSLAAIGRQLSYDDRSDSNNIQTADDTEYGYGLSLAGKWMFGSRNNLRFMANYGSALGRYMGLNAFNDGYISDDGSIETFNQYGGFIAYQQYWSDRWKSTFSISAAEADNPDVADVAGVGGWAKTYQSAHANLMYMPTPALSLGGELIYGTKELEDGRDGSLSRFQFSVKYGF